jgi:ribosomal protein S18 acetylase RimI-like enzyme
MDNSIIIYKAKDESDYMDTRKLFIEYASSLDFDLCFQGFDEELNSLPGKYSPPHGVILLAKIADKIAGCVGLRKIENNICEMKRLYVKPEFRGKGIGKILIENVITESKKTGYLKMKLDTIEEKMQTAVKLYREFGFYEIKKYTYNPDPHTLFMELDLSKSPKSQPG